MEMLMTYNDTFLSRLEYLVEIEGGVSNFARKVGIKQQTISASLGRGVNKPTSLSSEKIAKIIIATNCDANWLLTGAGEPFPKKDSTEKLSENYPDAESLEKYKFKMLLDKLLTSYDPTDPLIITIKTLLENWQDNKKGNKDAR